MTRLCRSTLLGVVLLGLAGVLGALPVLAQQTASLHGYVRDATTGETLLQANVVIEGTTRGTATNNSGYYTLRSLPPGTHTVVFSYVGFQRKTTTVRLAAGEDRRLDAELDPVELEGDEVVVTGEDQSEAERTISGESVSAAQIKELPSVLEPDVFRTLSLLPGVTTASDYSSSLYIRGGSPDQTLIQLNRTTVYNPTHFFGFFSTFNPDAIKDVQLYKGAYPVEYGGRLGSVIDIYNKSGNRRETTGGLSVGLLASRAYIEGPYGRENGEDPDGSYMLAVRRSTIEPVLAALRRSGTEGIPDAFAFYDVNGSFNYDLGPNDKLALSIYGGQDNLDLQFQEDGRFDIAYGNRTASTTWTHLFGGSAFSTVTLTGSRYESTPVGEIGGTRFTQTNEVSDVSLNADLEYTLSDAHTLQGGAEASVLTFRLQNTFDGNVSFRQRIQGEKAAVYLQETYEPSSAWRLQGGVRGTYFSRGDFWRFSPRLSVAYAVTPAVEVEAAYGRYHQFLTLETSQLFTGFDTWLMAAEGVPPSYGDQAALGVTAEWGEGWRLEVEGYARTMRDLFEQDPFLPNQAGVPYADRFHFGDGRAYGMEVLLRRSEGRYNGFLSYTLGRTERRFPNINVSNTGSPQYYPPKYDRTHNLTVAGNVELTDQWRLTSTFSYATGQAYTKPQYRYRLVNDPFLTDSEARTVLVSAFNNARLPAYHRLDVGVARTGEFFGIADYNLKFQVINAYSRRNIWFYQYQDEDDGTLSRTEVPQIPVPIPNLSFSLTF